MGFPREVVNKVAELASPHPKSRSATASPEKTFILKVYLKEIANLDRVLDRFLAPDRRRLRSSSLLRFQPAASLLVEGLGTEDPTFESMAGGISDSRQGDP